MNFIPKYKPGQIVYALAYSNEDTDKTLAKREVDIWDTNFGKIFTVEICYIGISKIGIEYTLSYPDDTDNEWSEPFNENMISDDKQVLINKLIEKWQL